MNFGVRKLESLGYHFALFASSYVQPFKYTTTRKIPVIKFGRPDGRTDGRPRHHKEDTPILVVGVSSINCFFMKLFKTSNIDVIKICQQYFNFEMPSSLWTCLLYTSDAADE